MKKPGLLVRMRALQHAVVRSVRHAKASGLGPVQIMLKTVRAIRRGPRVLANMTAVSSRLTNRLPSKPLPMNLGFSTMSQRSTRCSMGL
jgi:hypothetical protein